MPAHKDKIVLRLLDNKFRLPSWLVADCNTIVNAIVLVLLFECAGASYGIPVLLNIAERQYTSFFCFGAFQKA